MSMEESDSFWNHANPTLPSTALHLVPLILTLDFWVWQRKSSGGIGGTPEAHTRLLIPSMELPNILTCAKPQGSASQMQTPVNNCLTVEATAGWQSWHGYLTDEKVVTHPQASLIGRHLL